MELTEFEKRLKDHADRVKDMVVVPFHMDKEEYITNKKSYNMKKIIIFAAVVTCMLGTVVLGSYYMLSPQEVAERVGYDELAEMLEKDGTKFELPTQESGGYRIQVLGLLSGKDMGKVTVNGEKADDRSFLICAISRTDGEKFTSNYVDVMVSPLVSGYEPWKLNIFILAGSRTEFASEDKTKIYVLCEFDNIEIFADRTVYLAFYEGDAPDRGTFKYNSDGTIEFNENYKGVKVLFELPLDKSKADPEKAEQLLKKRTAPSDHASVEMTLD